MIVEKDRFVSIAYVLTNDEGETIDSTEESNPLGYIHGKGQLIPGLEEALEGKKQGDDLDVTLPPEKAYGPVREDLVQKVPKGDMGHIPNLAVGMQLQSNTPYGVQIFTVTDVNDEHVVVDGNHEMAGKTLHFKVKVAGVREATMEELNPPASSCGCGSGGGGSCNTGEGHEHNHSHSHGGCGCG